MMIRMCFTVSSAGAVEPVNVDVVPTDVSPAGYLRGLRKVMGGATATLPPEPAEDDGFCDCPCVNCSGCLGR